MHFHYRVTITEYIRCFCATTSHDLVTLTFDLLTLRVSHVQCVSCLTRTPIFIVLCLSVTELRVLNIWSYFRNLKQSLRMRHVTWPVTGSKNSPYFWNPWPQFVTFRALGRRLSHVIGETSVFPLWRLQSLLHMRSINWPVYRGSPKTTGNNFLTPNYLFTIQLFGLRWLRVVYIKAS